jgi:hypothetical protein
MHLGVASDIMARTTLNIDTPILRDLKRIQRREKKPLGRIVSDLLAEAMAGRGKEPDPPAFEWIAEKMEPLIDIADKESLYAALDGPEE